MADCILTSFNNTFLLSFVVKNNSIIILRRYYNRRWRGLKPANAEIGHEGCKWLHLVLIGEGRIKVKQCDIDCCRHESESRLNKQRAKDKNAPKWTKAQAPDAKQQYNDASPPQNQWSCTTVPRRTAPIKEAWGLRPVCFHNADFLQVVGSSWPPFRRLFNMRQSLHHILEGSYQPNHLLPSGLLSYTWASSPAPNRHHSYSKVVAPRAHVRAKNDTSIFCYFGFWFPFLIRKFKN